MNASTVARYACSRIRDGYLTYIRPTLPVVADHGCIGGWAVASPKLRLFDRTVPFQTPAYVPGYKRTAGDLIADVTKPGDTVTIIGGGHGVTMLEAAQQVARGPSGSVTVYEADAERAATLEATAALHGFETIVDVRHAVVADAYFTPDGSDDEAPAVVDPAALADCTILEMDCEGAEFDILSSMEITPATLVVETHEKKPYAPYDSSHEIIDLLLDRGYSVSRRSGPWVNSLLVAKLQDERP